MNIRRALIVLAAAALGAGACVPRLLAPVQPRPAPLPAGADVMLSVDGQPLRLLALATGNVTVTPCHHHGCFPEDRGLFRRMFRILWDDRTVPAMPVWSYVVIHPEGVFAVDAGAHPSFNDPATWACEPFGATMNHAILALEAPHDASLAVQLQARGLGPPDAVVLTHQHVDHTAGLLAFEDMRALTGRGDIDRARDVGATPCCFEGHATLEAVEDALPELEAAERADGLGAPRALTRDGRFVAFATGGHTPGSLTLRLTTDQGVIWFVGDLAFAAKDLDPEAPTAGIHTDPRRVRALQRTLAELTDGDLVLPAHDPRAARRLRLLGVRASAPNEVSRDAGRVGLVRQRR